MLKTVKKTLETKLKKCACFGQFKILAGHNFQKFPKTFRAMCLNRFLKVKGRVGAFNNNRDLPFNVKISRNFVIPL